MKAIGDKAMTLAVETSRNGGNLAESADLSKGKIFKMTALVVAVIRARIMDPTTTTTTWGKAPVTMMTKTQVNTKKREAIKAAEISRRTLRARGNVTHPHHLQAAPIEAAAMVAVDQNALDAPSMIRHMKAMMLAPD
jgi:hypothetical protein